MSTTTTNYSLIKPAVNDPTDEDLWGGYLNDDLDDIDALIKTATDAAGINQAAEASVASAATTDIGAASSMNVLITGTTNITSFGTVASGTVRKLRFADALTITHNGTSLICPNSENITTSANTAIEALSLGSGNWFIRYKSIPNATTSVKGISELATSAEILTGTDTERTMTPGDFAGNKSLGSNGYYKFPGGLMIQWGVDGGGSATRTINFPTAFPSACYVVIPVPTTNQRDTGVTGISSTSFSVSQSNAGTSLYWIAIGI